MIRFGPAGIPLSCKGRTLQDGIEDVHNLGLSAIEIQMVRSSVFARAPEEEEIGHTIREIEGGFVIGINRDGEQIIDPDEPIDEDDNLIYMPTGISSTFGDLYWTGEMARRLDVNLSVHTPYYMDLGSNNELTENCIASIENAGVAINALDGDIVVTSLGIYDEDTDPEETENNIIENVASIMEWWEDNNIKARLGVEISGHQDVFGSLDQILDLCDQFPGIVPVMNFSHHFSFTDGSLMEMDDFIQVIEDVERYSDGRIHSAFAGVECMGGNEEKLTPIKKGELRFEPLAEALIEVKPDITIISTSPLLEHDAMYMKIIYERMLTKKVAKDLKEKRKAEAAAAAGE